MNDVVAAQDVIGVRHGHHMDGRDGHFAGSGAVCHGHLDHTRRGAGVGAGVFERDRLDGVLVIGKRSSTRQCDGESICTDGIRNAAGQIPHSQSIIRLRVGQPDGRARKLGIVCIGD